MRLTSPIAPVVIRSWLQAHFVRKSTRKLHPIKLARAMPPPYLRRDTELAEACRGHRAGS
jgi:hypothetical protein